MAKYLIHASPGRMWYVTDYLIPSMVEQGIDGDNIVVWNDDHGNGCLKSTMASFASVEKNDTGIWHLQDDVLISDDFKMETERLDRGLVCGFCYDSKEDWRTGSIGFTAGKNVWFSFPCIRIPNQLAREVADWFFKTVLTEGLFPDLVVTGKHDDTLFVNYIETFRPDDLILNYSPGLVEHVDYLVGGSIVNPNRKVKKTHGLYSYERFYKKIEDLKNKLIADGRLVNGDG